MLLVACILICDLVFTNDDLLRWKVFLSLIKELSASTTLPHRILYLNLDRVVLSIDLLDFNIDIFEFFVFFINEV